MFEKRTKNVKIKDNCTSVLVNVDSDPQKGNIETVAVCYQGFDLDGTKEEAVGNAEFICFCFNLQQKYDIGLFESTIGLLKHLVENNMCSVVGDDLIEELLTEIEHK